MSSTTRKGQTLRDHMTEAELTFTALAELFTRQIAETVDATGNGGELGGEDGKPGKKRS